jgi:hypothetical protein
LCFKTDLFGDWIPDEWIHQVLAVVSSHPEYHFYCHTGNPTRCLEFEFSENIELFAWAYTQKTLDAAMSAFEEMDSPIAREVIYQPFIEPVKFTAFGRKNPWKIFYWKDIKKVKTPGDPRLKFFSTINPRIIEIRDKVTLMRQVATPSNNLI